MAGTTARYGLALMSGGSDDPSPDEVADIKVVNDGLKLIDGFLGAKDCTSGTRPASPKLGQIIVESDTKNAYYWTATGWESLAPGLRLVKPATIASTAGSSVLAPTGKIDFTAVTALSLNGVFSPLYDNYVMMLNVNTSVLATILGKYRRAGVDILPATGRNQHASLAFGVGSPWAAASDVGAAGTGMLIAYSSGVGGCSARVEFFNAYAAVEKVAQSSSSSSQGMDFLNSWVSAGMGVADGITLTPTGGTMTGTLRVYGYNNG